ncbi:CapA family protein [Arcanobacterium haemolyticum]|nr:CapA family protein [Arcanobacterium haemolyticum]
MRRKLFFACAAAFAVAACSPAVTEDASQAPHSPDTNETSSETATPTPTPTSVPSQMSIVAGGDILLHLSVNEFARTSSGYDYTPLFAGITPWISGADLALCNLEVPIVPEGEKPSNYPMFGSPPDIAASLKTIGWDGCSLATNHSMDRGVAGVTSTLATFDSVGLGHAGTARSQEEADSLTYYTLSSGGRDVTIAHLSATTLTNGIPIPSTAPYSWNVVGSLGLRSVDDLIADARRARTQGADLVVLSMHWGTEYVSQPIEEQETIAERLAASGTVDLVLGNHSHVPEPVAKLPGGPDNAGMWVVWSMGNMISGQTIENHGYRVTTGLLTTATVDVPAEGPAHVSNLEWSAVTQDTRTDHLFMLSELMADGTGTGMTLTPAQIQARADATYPVMTADGSVERTEAPVGQSTLVSVTRK